MSLHRYLTFRIDITLDKIRNKELFSMELNKQIFRHSLMLTIHGREINCNNISEIIIFVQDFSSTRPGGEFGSRQPYWSNVYLAYLRRRCMSKVAH